MHRHLKRTDFCLWSAPPAPLAGVVGALLGDDFPRTVYEHNCSGFLQDCRRSDKLIPLAPVVSENILLCGMREVNASLSRQSDRNHWPNGSGHNVFGGRGGGGGWAWGSERQRRCTATARRRRRVLGLNGK